MIHSKGYTIAENVFSSTEIDAMTAVIESADSSNPAFRRTSDLFAIRRFLQAVSAIQPLLFTPALQSLINNTFGAGYAPVRSIYFDKPPGSNWFVAWHQDLTISVDRKLPLPGFGPWTVKGDNFAVQPPIDILKDMYTIRIHLDDTDETNGALRVLPGSHLNGIERHTPTKLQQLEETCRVPRGGVMIMRPLLQHASSRSSSGRRRRVIHIEFSNADLPDGLHWAERVDLLP